MGYLIPHLTFAYPKDRVEGPAYHSPISPGGFSRNTQKTHWLDKNELIYIKSAEGDTVLISLQDVSCLSGFS